jgi:hypothetical protein
VIIPGSMDTQNDAAMLSDKCRAHCQVSIGPSAKSRTGQQVAGIDNSGSSLCPGDKAKPTNVWGAHRPPRWSLWTTPALCRWRYGSFAMGTAADPSLSPDFGRTTSSGDARRGRRRCAQFSHPDTDYLMRPAPAGIERPGVVEFTPRTFSTLPADWRLFQIEGPQQGGGGPPRGEEDLTDEHPR